MVTLKDSSIFKASNPLRKQSYQIPHTSAPLHHVIIPRLSRNQASSSTSASSTLTITEKGSRGGDRRSKEFQNNKKRKSEEDKNKK